MNREQLINEARAALAQYEGTRSTPRAERVNARDLAVVVRDMLAVFEEAHTPIDDEREALADLILSMGLAADADDDRYVAEQTADRILAAGFRRTVQGDHYDEGTLVKVYDALQRVMPDVSEWVIRDQVNAMQNAGILFRERRTVQGEPLPACGYCGDRLGAPGCPAHGEPQGEPSDAQVLAALNAYYADYMIGPNKSLGEVRPLRTVQDMRAALRAAAEQGGNR